MTVSSAICMQTLLLVSSATLIQIEGCTPKGGHIPMPGICDYVILHGRGALSLKMGLSLLNSRQGIILDYLCSVSQLCLTHYVTPWTVAHQAPLSMEFSRQEYWSELPVPSPGIFQTQRSSPCLLHLLNRQADSLPLSQLGSPLNYPDGPSSITRVLKSGRGRTEIRIRE